MTSATPHVPRPGQSNFAILAEEIAKRVATYQNGSPTTIIGPPTGGTRVLNEFWRDALGGEFRCTQASTPGTWIQITVYRAASGRPDAVPGMVGAIQMSGQLIPVRPHVHALLAEAVFLPERGAFLPLAKLATEPFPKLAFGLHSVVCQFEKTTAREAVLGAWWHFRSSLP